MIIVGLILELQTAYLTVKIENYLPETPLELLEYAKCLLQANGGLTLAQINILVTLLPKKKPLSVDSKQNFLMELMDQLMIPCLN